MSVAIPSAAQLAPLTQWLTAQATPLWIVGGALRDLCAGKPSGDIDLLVAGDALAVARRCADAQHGAVAILDPVAGVARVTLPGLPFQCDFVTLQGDTLADDLVRRDFTVNAMALPLSAATLRAVVQGEANADLPIIDPFGGRDDLATKTLRMTSASTFAADPLRVMRAARVAAALDLRLDDATHLAAQASVSALTTVAPERILAEFYAIFARPEGASAMRLLDAMTALVALVPPLASCRGVRQGRLHHWDVFDHTLAVIDEIDHVVALLEAGSDSGNGDAPTVDAAGHVPHPTAIDLKGHNAAILARLRETPMEHQSRLTLLKLSALFHDVGKPLTQIAIAPNDYRFPGHPEAGVPLTTPIVQAWRMGRPARRFVASVVACHMRPGQMAGPKGLTDRAARHFFRDAGDAGIDIAIFSLADHLGVYGPAPLTPFWLSHSATVAELVRRFYEEPERVIPPRLIDGNDLIARYGVERGPQLGHLLDLVQHAHLDGDIATRAEAFALVEQTLAATARGQETS